MRSGAGRGLTVHHIFISYSRADGDWVRSLAKRLEQQRHEVWIDSEDIPVTVPWMAEVQDAIEEAALFLRCDSLAFGRSDSCSAEVSLATQAAKPQFVVTVGDDLDRCASQVDQTVRAISSARTQRTELRVLSRDWDRAGRPRNRLVSSLQRRRLSLALAVPPPVLEVEHSFLRASRSRARWRALVTSVTVVLIATSVLTTSVLRTAQDRINTANSQEAAAYTGEQDGLNLVDQDPYGGLQVAAQDGGDEANVHAEVISAALAEPTPDNAFAVPRARRFAVRPVGADVIVADAAGRDWSRSSATADARAATPGPAPVPVSPAPAPGGRTARAGSRSGLVEIRERGELWRRVTFDGVPQATAFSPDGRFLAAAIGEQVDVADLSTGQIRIHMRGATGDLLDVAWSTDGRHVWALSGNEVFSWLTGDVYTLADNPDAAFNSVLPASSPRAVWIVGRHVLTEISVATGQVLARRAINDTLDSAGATPDGSLALVSGQRHLWVVPLSGSAPPRSVDIRGCPLGRPTFSDDSTAYLPCIGGDLLTLAMPSASVISSVNVSAAGVFGATALPGSHAVYVGDQAGYLYVVAGSRVTRIWASECDVDMSRIAVAPGDQAVLPVGSGSGMGTCTRIGLHSPGDPSDASSWTWNAVLEEQESSIFGSAASFSPHGGSFAIGYSDGTITMHPTQNLTPTVVVNTAAGMIRDMLTLSNGDLIIVTDEGMVQRLNLCDTCISDAALSKVAAAHLQVAEHLGLARPQPQPTSSS